MTDPRYPIGRFAADANPTPETRARHIEAIAGLPPRMRQAVASLKANQLDTPYRDGGWRSNLTMKSPGPRSRTLN